ncbi:MAG: hypothetical protein EOO73_11270 [Myxococcales bacterium]|nr:MAG: hypothetical protein EOO73_11270 [Myxococcales bacterium]
MRSASEDRANAGGAGPADTSRRAAGWVWWGLIAGLTLVLALSVVYAVRAGNDGYGINRGPADEAAPGAAPTQDIDRSSKRQP